MSTPTTYRDVVESVDALAGADRSATPSTLADRLIAGWDAEQQTAVLRVLMHHTAMTVRAFPVNPASRSTPKAKPTNYGATRTSGDAANTERVRYSGSTEHEHPCSVSPMGDTEAVTPIGVTLGSTIVDTNPRPSRWGSVARLHADGDLLGQAVTADSGATTLGDCTMNDIAEMARTAASTARDAARTAKEARVTAEQYIGLIAAMKKANVGTVRDLGPTRVRAALTLEPSEAARATA